MKKFLKNISPFNNKTDMPNILFVLKKILAFWICYIAGLFIAEGFAILLHFAMGKNMLVGEVFERLAYALPFVHAAELEKALFQGDLGTAASHIFPILLYSVGTTAAAVVCFLRQMKKH